MDTDLIEQLNESCCPICGLLEKFEFNLMANLQWDVGVAENSQVKQIIEEQGFCNHHFYMLFRMSNPQHLSKFLLRYIDDFLQNRLALPERWERNFTVCEQVDHRTEELILEFSKLYQSEASFRAKFHHNAWLCLPHLRQVIATALDQNLKTDLLQHHRKILDDFGATMRSFIDKRYTEAESEERGAPLRTIQLMAGFHGTRWSK
jgi:hypothetical protein